VRLPPIPISVMETPGTVVGWALYILLGLYALSGLIHIASTASKGCTVTYMSLAQWAFALGALAIFGFSTWSKLHLLWVIPVAFVLSLTSIGRAIGRITGIITAVIFPKRNYQDSSKETAMGIFSRLFGPSSDIEKDLETLYVPMFQMMMGMTLTQAKSTFHDLYRQAENEAKAEGSINLPVNLGDILLEKESTRQETKSMLAKRRKEGVRDEDIRCWMNRHELDRKMMIKVDDISKLALFTKLIKEDRLSEEEAAIEVKKYFPVYGDPDDTSTSSGDDRPLPFELKDRINIYIQKRSQTDPEKYKKEIAESSSFNALIRKEIKKGNI